mmetsp:Transcript_13843/g.16776  ORF Transcript_13843/g.16776 Transcript_13843/m.16776 type:complete len:362 (-) Transcript_13843:86-1171(-)
MGVKRRRNDDLDEKSSRKVIKKLPWSKSEDDQLVKAVQENSTGKTNPDGSLIVDITWGEIAAKIPNRNAKQCRERWCFNLDPCIKRGHWTIREDAILIKAQQTFGNQWIQVARFLKGRTENSVKTRFKSIIRAGEREWTKQEDDIIEQMHAKIGSKWSIIQNMLPGRSANAVKVRYRRVRKGNTKENIPIGSPRQLWHHKQILDEVDLKKIISDQLPSNDATSNALMRTIGSIPATSSVFPISVNAAPLTQAHLTGIATNNSPLGLATFQYNGMTKQENGNPLFNLNNPSTSMLQMKPCGLQQLSQVYNQSTVPLPGTTPIQKFSTNETAFTFNQNPVLAFHPSFSMVSSQIVRPNIATKL